MKALDATLISSDLCLYCETCACLFMNCFYKIMCCENELIITYVVCKLSPAHLIVCNRSEVLKVTDMFLL